MSLVNYYEAIDEIPNAEIVKHFPEVTKLLKREQNTEKEQNKEIV